MGAVSTAVEKRDAAPAKPSRKEVIRHLLDVNRDAIGLSLPRGFDRDRFSRLLLTAANTNPKLFECDPMSFMAAGCAAATLGLEPNDARGLAYLVPFKDKDRGLIVQLLIGYRGKVDLARRSGMVSSIHAFPVFEGDAFRYTLGLEPTIEHEPGAGWDDMDPAKLTHAYAVAKVQGEPQFAVVTRKQVETAKARSQTGRYNKGPWATDYVEMALKTAVHRLGKMLPQTVEMATAEALEERPLVLGEFGLEPAEHDAIEATSTEPPDNVNGETGEITNAEHVTDAELIDPKVA